GAIGHFEPPAPPPLLVLGQELLGMISSGGAGALEDFQGQAFAGLAIGAGALVHGGGQAGATEQGLNLAHDYAARRALQSGKKGVSMFMSSIITGQGLTGKLKCAR